MLEKLFYGEVGTEPSYLLTENAKELFDVCQREINDPDSEFRALLLEENVVLPDSNVSIPRSLSLEVFSDCNVALVETRHIPDCDETTHYIGVLDGELHYIHVVDIGCGHVDFIAEV